VTPELTYEEFAKLSDEELRDAARAFKENEISMFRAFEETNDDEFFDNFRGAIEKAIQEFAKRFAELLKPQQDDILALARSFAELSVKAASSIHKAIKYFQGSEFQGTLLAQVLKGIGEFSRIQQTQLDLLRPAIASALSSLDKSQLKMIADFNKSFTEAHRKEGFFQDVHRLASQMTAAQVQAPPAAFSRQLALGTTELVKSGEENTKARESVERLVQDKIDNLPQERVSLEGLILILTVISILISLSQTYLTYRQQEGSKASLELQNKSVREEEIQTAYLGRIAERIEKLTSNLHHILPIDPGTYYFVGRPVDVRVKPTTESSSVAKLYQNQRVELIQRKHKWMCVRYFDYTEAVPRNGWVLKKYLKMVKN
jgi:Bacterial SH3 domain